jgi:threonine dehydrogenase-like Zn-dependent dehydrogenase
MKALCWHGTNDIRCDNVPDPKIEDGRDVIIKVTSCAICGSDLHLMDGLMPTMKSGDILGHEFMGEVVETGSAHNKFRKGDRIVVPFNINCGECRQCKLGNYSVCQRSNRNAAMAAAQFGYRRPASSAIPTSPADTQAARQNMCGCRWPMSRP